MTAQEWWRQEFQRRQEVEVARKAFERQYLLDYARSQLTPRGV